MLGQTVLAGAFVMLGQTVLAGAFVMPSSRGLKTSTTKSKVASLATWLKGKSIPGEMNYRSHIMH